MLEIQSAKLATHQQRKQLYEFLIIAYAVTEIEVWGPNYVRIEFEDYDQLIEKGEVLIAYFENVVVGGIHFSQRGESTYSFSLLCADFNKSGLGIGRALIEEVEKIAKDNGAVQIEIEILRPKGIEVPFKVRLKDWYQKLGYHYTWSENFALVRPEKAKKLVTPSDFDHYLKKLI
jgi:GNAT superfamily N-acetyltransferase